MNPGSHIHPEWEVHWETAFKKPCGISNNPLDSSYNDSVIIVSGNCGIGNKSKKYYEETFGKLDKILADNNCFLLFVRGNNDNPSIFNNKEIDFEHIKTLPDYSVVSLKTFNCLCIGGSVSMDKEWKLAQEELYGKKLYWEDESPQYKEDELNEILEKYKINCVITSTCPSFAYPGTNAFKKSKWFYRDKEIISQFSNERKIMDRIYEKIMDSDSKPYMWIYGRFKMAHTDKLNDIVFNSLNSYGMIQINSQLQAFFGIDTSKTLEDNAHTFDNIISDIANNNTRIYGVEAHDDEPFEGDIEADLDAEVDGEDEQVENGEQAAPIDPQYHNEALRNYLAAHEVGVAATAEPMGVYDYQAQAVNYAPINNYTIEDVNSVTRILGELGHPVR